MELLDNLKVYYGSEERNIELYHGDLINMGPEDAVDILVISAFPNDYLPTSGSLIGALLKKEINVRKLAKEKEVDLRKLCSCWLSKEINSQDPGIQFKRILCFEPYTRGEPITVVGDIFRSLAPILGGDESITKVAMPLVACGDQMTKISIMFPQLIDAAVHWMSLGIPLKVLKIVIYSEDKAIFIKNLFANLKKKYQKLTTEIETKDVYKYDIFVSYSHENIDEVDFIVEKLKKKYPELRIFLDRMELNPGSAWQQEIFNALDVSKKIIAVYSPPYLKSKVCKEEYNIAHFINRNSNEEVLIPIYLYSTQLPTYMKLIQYFDCREGDKEKLREAIEKINISSWLVNL